MIKNIVFDLGNVILKSTPKIILNNIEMTKEKKEIIETTFFNNWEQLDLGYITIAEHLNKCGLPSDIIENYREILINYYKFRPFNMDIIELIHSLKRNNYNIYILSNNNLETYEYLKTLPLFKSIDGWVVSCNYNVMKPDKRIYEILFHKYNIDPSASFFIDDKNENIATGKALGMDGHVLQYEKYGICKLVKDLTINGIDCSF